MLIIGNKYYSFFFAGDTDKDITLDNPSFRFKRKRKKEMKVFKWQ